MERWGKYWIIYYLVFLAVFAFLLRRHWDALDWSNESYLFLLAAIFGVSAGTALTVTIFTELGGAMVLLIPSTYKRIKETGRKEGLEEGRQGGIAEGRLLSHQDWVEWNERRAAAAQAGLPFDEPPPSIPQSRSRNGQ